MEKMNKKRFLIESFVLSLFGGMISVTKLYSIILRIIIAFLLRVILLSFTFSLLVGGIF